MKKVNCWEHMRCGRELGGHNQHLGVCPAATTIKLNGVHGGIHGGRSCWVINHTLCGGSDQGTFADKYRGCKSCSFYGVVTKEEGMQFVLAPLLLGKLRGEATVPGEKPAAVSGSCSQRPAR